MSIYKLVTIDQRFIAETIARTGSEQLLNKVARSFVGLYSQDENWYIPLRANLGKKKPEGAYFETPFETTNSHFKRPGLDFEKSIYVPIEYTIEIRNTLPTEQSELIFSKQEEIRQSFEEYVLRLERLDKNAPSYKFSTVPLFPEGVKKVKEMQTDTKVIQEDKGKSKDVFNQETLFDNMIDLMPNKSDKDLLVEMKDGLEDLQIEQETHLTWLYEFERLSATGEIDRDNYGGNWIKKMEQSKIRVDELTKEIKEKKKQIQTLEGNLNKKNTEEKQKGGGSMSTIKDKIESPQESITDHAKALIDSDEINQWPKNPTIYFISGLRKVALELTTEGTFVESKKYPATTEEAKKKVVDLLSGEAVVSPKIPSEKEDRSIQDIIKQKDYKALSSHLKDGISSYLETDTFKNYLNFVSKFHKYSHKNVRLLLDQNPNTTRVAGLKKWEEVGRTVKSKPETLYVYAPGSKIVKDKNGKPVKDENGQVVKEKFFFLTPVFDVSQTNGEPLPKPIHDLEGNFETPDQFVKVFKAIENISPVPVKIEPIEGTARGYYHKLNKEIVVKNGLGEMMTLKTMIHEITHAKLHADSTCAFGDKQYSQQEFEAESVAYIVSNHLGIDTNGYSFGYLASWTKQGQSVDSFTESLDRITKEAQQIIDSLDKSLSLSFAMSEPANKFEERVAKAQGRDIQPPKSETKAAKKEIEPTVPKEERPRLNP